MTINRPSTFSKKRRLNHGHIALMVCGLATLGLYVIPVPFLRTIAYPFALLSTLAHEMGHGLTGMLVGAHFNSFEMWADGSGVANVSGSVNRASQALVAAGGLVGPALMSALLFTLSVKPALSRFTLTVLGVALLAAEFLLIRNMFGWFFVGGLAAICLLVAQQSLSWLAQYTLVFFAMQLGLSVFSRADYLFTPVAHTASGTMPSDVAQISHALVLPYWFWGGACALISGVVLLFGLLFFIKKS